MKKKYIEIKEYLLEKIKSGEYRVDQAIPPERELAAMLNVNRMTVRKAIEELMYDGLLVRKKGSGTFLTNTKKTRTDLLDSASDEETFKVISCKLCHEGNYASKVLQIPLGAPYWRLRRLRLLHLTPYAYEDIYFSVDFFLSIEKDLYEKSLHDIINDQLAKVPLTLYQEVEALLCLHNTAVLLKVQAGSPILQIKTYVESKTNRVLFRRSYHPGDSYLYKSPKKDFSIPDR